MAIIDVVKFNGTPDVFAWRFPSDQLTTGAQLIVNDSQEAVFFKDGRALDVFSGGVHTLETDNLPLLRNLYNLPFGGRTPFAAEVWFVNRTHVLDIKWGTPSPIQLQDPKYGIFAPVRSFGHFGVRIVDSRKFLQHLVGTVSVFDKNNLIKYFRSFFVTKVKDTISSYLVHKQVSILEINAYLMELSDHMKAGTAPLLEEYGIQIVSFHINDISIPEDDPAVQKLKDALAKRAEMNIIGYDYHQERSFNTLENAAKSTVASTVVGVGVGAGLGSVATREIEGISRQLDTAAGKLCPDCGNRMLPDSRYCRKCGADSQKGEPKQAPKCSKCGTALNPAVKFCPECGDKYTPCPNCLADIPEGQTQCPVCGGSLPGSCPGCGAAVKEGVKFCPECGHSLIRACPGCGKSVAGSPKFCPECGGKL